MTPRMAINGDHVVDTISFGKIIERGGVEAAHQTIDEIRARYIPVEPRGRGR